MNYRYSFLTFPERLERWQKFLPYALLLSVTLALFGTTLYYHFVWDDLVYVTQNYRIQGLSWPRTRAIWTGTYLGHYAPMHHTFLAILHSFSGMDPFGYHLGQLLVHAACVCLLFFVLKRVESPRVALLAGLLFAVHPTSIETVAWISETKSTLAFLFFLLSFWAYLQLCARERWRYLILCAVFLILSILSKINTIVAPAIFLLYDYRQGAFFGRRKVWGLLCLFLISTVFVAVHLAVNFHGAEAGLESSYYGGLGVHIQNLPFLLFFYIRMAFIPHPLSAWHMFRVYDRFTWVVGAGWIVLLAVVWLLHRSNRNIQFWGLWFLVFLAPVLQIIPFPIWVADRYLYIPGIGLFVLASKLFFWVWDRITQPWRRLGWEVAMCSVLLAYAWHTQNHLPVWRNDLLLWEATARTCTTSAYCHSNVGEALLQTGQVERGVKELIRSVEIRPIPRYLVRLGDAYTLSLGDYRQALIAYNLALDQGGSQLKAEFYAKLARAYFWAGQPEQASAAIQAGWKVDAYDPSLLVANGFLQWKLGNLQAARESLRKALIITGQTSHPAGFIYYYWGNPVEVGRLISDLRSPQASDSSRNSPTLTRK